MRTNIDLYQVTVCWNLVEREGQVCIFLDRDHVHDVPVDSLNEHSYNGKRMTRKVKSKNAETEELIKQVLVKKVHNFDRCRLLSSRFHRCYIHTCIKQIV